MMMIMRKDSLLANELKNHESVTDCFEEMNIHG